MRCWRAPWCRRWTRPAGRSPSSPATATQGAIGACRPIWCAWPPILTSMCWGRPRTALRSRAASTRLCPPRLPSGPIPAPPLQTEPSARIEAAADQLVPAPLPVGVEPPRPDHHERGQPSGLDPQAVGIARGTGTVGHERDPVVPHAHQCPAAIVADDPRGPRIIRPGHADDLPSNRDYPKRGERDLEIAAFLRPAFGQDRRIDRTETHPSPRHIGQGGGALQSLPDGVDRRGERGRDFELRHWRSIVSHLPPLYNLRTWREQLACRIRNASF